MHLQKHNMHTNNIWMRRRSSSSAPPTTTAALLLIVCTILQCISIASSAATTAADVVTRTCEPIRIDLCRGIGYNETSMPNLVGHDMQSDADFTLQTFSPLIQYGCSAQLNFFLCSAYVPMCTPKVPVPIGPCRGLCEAVRARCHPVLQGFGFPWPAALECSRFPKENNHEHMCMEGPGEPGGGALLPQPTSKITSTQHPACDGLAKSNLYIRLNRSGKCAPLCEADILFGQREKHIAEIWMTSWSVAALVTAVLAVFCLIVSDTKWDKVLIPLVTCHSMVAVGWTIRFITGRTASACGYDPQLPGVSLLLTDGLSNASCAATFLLRYYFGMSAGIWWSILCMKWHVTVRRSRNDSLANAPHATTLGGLPAVMATAASSVDKCSGNKETYGTFTKLAAWVLPALQTAAVLVARVVDADELFGACFVGNQSDKAFRILVVTPLFIYWIFGAVNLFAGYLVHRRQALNHPTPAIPPPAKGFPANLNGMGTFLFIYCVPSAVLLIAVFYEFANRDIWLSPAPEMSDTVSHVPDTPMTPFMMRAFMELLVGVLAFAWTLGPRIATVWRSKVGPKYKQTPSKFQPSAYSTASYQTVCPQNSMVSVSMSKVSIAKMPRHGRKYPPSHVSHNKQRSYKASSQTMSLTGNETVL